MKKIAAYALLTGAMMGLLPQIAIASSLALPDFSGRLNVGHGSADGLSNGRLETVAVVTVEATEQLSCMREQITTYLDSLQVVSCLVATNQSFIPPMASHIRQTLTNAGKQVVELELVSNMILRSGITVFKDRNLISKSYVPPTPHDSKLPRLTVEQHVLKPGEAVVFTYQISDFMNEKPRDDVIYSVGVNAKYPYRYLNEPKGNALLLRLDEGNAKKQYVQNPFFENVRIR
jgi:hypothetical protein